VLEELGMTASRSPGAPFEGNMEDVQHPTLLENMSAGALAIVAARTDGKLAKTAEATLRAAAWMARRRSGPLGALVLAPSDDASQRIALGMLASAGAESIVLWITGEKDRDLEISARLLVDCWPDLSSLPAAIVGEPWTENAFATLTGSRKLAGTFVPRVRGLDGDNQSTRVTTSRDGDRLSLEQSIDADIETPLWMTVTAETEIGTPSRPVEVAPSVQRWSPRTERFFAQSDVQMLLDELKKETGIVRLADAEYIVDVGFGVGNRDGYEAVIEPLVRTLEAMGVKSLVVGGSRKVTEELHILPVDRQIGQSGVSVNPQLLIAIGVSGAPQHLNYIGPRATILAFNRDPDAPLMTLNQRQARPRVYPVLGNLFETVPALTAALRATVPQRSTVDAPMTEVRAS
jgi:electron transfer flavoprotein alpha subunit